MPKRKNASKIWSAPTDPSAYVTAKNHFLQTLVWADVRQRHGWQPIPVYVETAELGQVQLFLYIRHVPGLGNVGYAPMWPQVFTASALESVLAQLRAIARQHGLFVVHIEPAVSPDLDPKLLKKYRFVATGEHIQYLSTLVVDLEPSFDQVFANFSATTRNEIRRAEKQGLVCTKLPLSDDNLARFYSLLRGTQARQKFYVRKKAFLYDYWRAFDKAGQATLYQTTYEGQTLAMAFVITNGQRAFYKDAAALLSGDAQKLGGSVFQQSMIMRDLKARGVTSYDLCGALANGVESPTDPLWNVYQFKKRFTKNLVSYAGIIDLPINQAKYQLWRRLRHHYAHLYSATTRQLWY